MNSPCHGILKIGNNVVTGSCDELKGFVQAMVAQNDLPPPVDLFYVHNTWITTSAGGVGFFYKTDATRADWVINALRCVQEKDYETAESCYDKIGMKK